VAPYGDAGRLHVAHVITGLGVGGAETMLSRLVTGADPSRIRMSVVSLSGAGALGALLTAAGIEVQAITARHSVHGLARAHALWRLLRRLRPDIVQTWLYHADFLGLVAAGRVPVLWNLRCSDMEFAQGRAVKRLALRGLGLLSPLPRGVIVNSLAGQRFHAALGYRPRRWEVIPNGIDVDRFAPDAGAGARLRGALGWPDDAVVIGHVARLHPMKDHGNFLQAARRVAEARPQARFVLVGDGTEALASQALAGALGNRLAILGRCMDVDRRLPGFDLFCLSSAYGEGFPNVLAEAMACAVPCVTTDVGDARLIVGQTGVAVPRRNAEALAGAIIAMIDAGATERHRRGEAARARVVASYTLRRCVERYEALYRDLVPTPRVNGEHVK
jgi:glycosyltransferase involved in cell wall biosynthesis